MAFKSFIESLAYVYLTEPDFQTIATVAGVDWFKLPGDLDAVKIVRRYLEARSAKPHAAAVHEIRDDIRFLDACDLDLKAIPTDESVLAFELKRVLRRHSFEELGRELLKNPERGDALVADFSTVLSEPVKFAQADALISYEITEHLARVKAGKSIVSIPGFELLSKAIGGFNPGRIIMITGATGFGKTNAGLNIAIRAAVTRIVGFLNMEMVFPDITKRIVVIGTGTSYGDYANGIVNESVIAELGESIKGRLHITDGRSLSLQAIEAWVRMMAKRGMEMLFVDYDQKIDLPYDRSTPEWKAIQKAIQHLEDLAKELNFCCIVFVQVNREGEVSASHRATFAAHTVISFEEHPEYGPVLWAKKNRHGERDVAIKVSYEQKTSRIFENEVVRINPKTKTPERVLKTEFKKSPVNWGEL